MYRNVELVKINIVYLIIDKNYALKMSWDMFHVFDCNKKRFGLKSKNGYAKSNLYFNALHGIIGFIFYFVISSRLDAGKSTLGILPSTLLTMALIYLSVFAVVMASILKKQIWIMRGAMVGNHCNIYCNHLCTHWNCFIRSSARTFLWKACCQVFRMI